MEKAINKTFNASRHFQLTNYEVDKKFAGYMHEISRDPGMVQSWWYYTYSHIGYYMNHELKQIHDWWNGANGSEGSKLVVGTSYVLLHCQYACLSRYLVEYWSLVDTCGCHNHSKLYYLYHPVSSFRCYIYHHPPYLSCSPP